uniref:Ig-like domain-containing protein n=1 Tax=Plectus sambesii TaxID=2011161 RepID=A0A914XPK7_9BILA
MSSYIVCLFVSLCCSLIIASTTGGAIHKNSKNAKRSTDHISCLAPVDGPRLGFQNEHGKNMKDQLVAAGERVELKCEVFGTPQATIRWKHNGILMEKSAPIGNYESRMENGDEPIIGLSTTVAVLVIDCVDDETAGHYSCVADNGCTEAIEASAIVAIEQNGK